MFVRKVHELTSYFGVESRFAGMLLLSILFHGVAFTPLLISGGSGISGAKVPFFDLNISMESSPSTPAEAVQKVRDEGVVSPEESSPPEDLSPPSELDKLTENNRRSVAEAGKESGAIDGASLGLSITNGYFASIGDGETLRDDIREYYLDILRRINEKWWVSGGGRLSPNRNAVFFLIVARNGAIVDKMLVESSGNPAFDRAMLHTLESASPLPPLPELYRGDFFQAPLRFNAPLNLLKQWG
jgi:protein TonB